VIDYFLAQNPDLHDIGRLAIAMVIFDCEREYHTCQGNPNHIAVHNRRVGQRATSLSPPDVEAFSDDWLRFVQHKLVLNCDPPKSLADNQLTFVTFNYDASLEKRLYDGLSNISKFPREEVQHFFDDLRIVHVYGKVREKVDTNWVPTETSLGNPSWRARERLDDLFIASQGIRTIDGPDKLKNEKELSRARDKLRDAAKVYILGYGFDHSNNGRLDLEKLHPRAGIDRHVYFTNYRGLNRISRASGRAFGIYSEAFIETHLRSEDYGIQIAQRNHFQTVQRRVRYEMSPKNVYEALSEDFEL
jgi:hypothetical protein